jgi:hypothetical protein
MAKWIKVSFTQAVVHVVPASFYRQLVRDMVMRGHTISDYAEQYGQEYAEMLGANPRPIKCWGIDMGGSCYMGRPLETLRLGGLSLKIPSEELEHWRLKLQGCPTRTFTSEVKPSIYYKLHAWCQALVMSPFQRAHLLAQLDMRIPQASARAKAFYATHPPVGDVIADAFKPEEFN